jgi:tetratricopeptide (TPR) repeat protein
LILAMAVVWDQPRPPIHHQMGRGQLPFKPEVEARYDYFRDLYDSNRGEMPYRDLSVTALTFVVDVPVPLSELEWVRENERPRAWDKKYSDIHYVDARLEAKIFQWPEGPYTLANIKEKGGICTDQGYYAVMCARAWGLPALFFGGAGRRGPHAWMGYMERENRWEMEVGRYTYDKYATGHAVDPQTNEPMSDHYVEFICDRSLRYSKFRLAARYGRLAHVLATMGYAPAARQVAELSLDNASLYEFTWLVLEDMLAKEKAHQELYDLLERKATVFRKYDDIVTAVRTRQAELLRDMGQDDKADRLLSRKSRQMNKDRDDLSRFLANEQVQAAYEKGDYDEAMKKFEDMLDDQKKEGQKIFGLMQSYLGLAAEMDRSEDAAKFLKRYVSGLRRMYDNTPDNERLFLQVLEKAYELAGDERNLKRVQKDLERL